MVRAGSGFRGLPQFVYVPGSHHFYRYAYQPDVGALVADPEWQPLYRTGPDDVQGFTWDSCLAGGGCWFLDNGDNEANTVIFGSRPFGQQASNPQRRHLSSTMARLGG